MTGFSLKKMLRLIWKQVYLVLFRLIKNWKKQVAPKKKTKRTARKEINIKVADKREE